MGLLGPLAVVVSRTFREFRPLWIWFHGGLALTALVGGIVGVIFGSQLPDLTGSVYSAHKGIGAAAVALYGLQVLGAFFRTKPIHASRKVFNFVHHWLGRLGIVLAIINVYLGLKLAKEKNKFYWGYAIILGSIMLLWITKEVLDFFAVMESNRRGPESHKRPGPVNGSFASRFLLHGRPQVGKDYLLDHDGPDSHLSKPTTPVRRNVHAHNGSVGSRRSIDSRQAEGIQLSRV